MRCWSLTARPQVSGVYDPEVSIGLLSFAEPCFIVH